MEIYIEVNQCHNTHVAIIYLSKILQSRKYFGLNTFFGFFEGYKLY